MTSENAAIRKVPEKPIIEYLDLLRGVVGPLGEPVYLLLRKCVLGVVLRLVRHFVRAHFGTEKSEA